MAERCELRQSADTSDSTFLHARALHTGARVQHGTQSYSRVTRARFSALLSPAEICSLWIVLFLLIALARMAAG